MSKTPTSQVTTDVEPVPPGIPTATVKKADHWWAALFRSLKHRSFRLLWFGQALQSEGQWMEQVARGWLLWELSHDPFMLGLYATMRNLPNLVMAIPAGLLTDRVSRVALIQVSQISACLLSIAFALLVQLNIIAVWMILAFATLNGVAESLRGPARQSMVATLVPGGDLLNAVAVNEVAQYTMRITGPLMAGVIMSAFPEANMGVAAVFYLRGFLYLLAVITTALIEAPPMPTGARQRSIWQNLGDGVQYLGQHKPLLAIAMLGVAPGAFGQPYQHLMPIFALDIFDVGPLGLGIMSAMVGIGALVGSLYIAAVGEVRRMGLFLFLTLFAYGVFIMLFALNSTYLLALLLLLLIGASQATFMAIRQALTQLLVQDEFRGRIVSVSQLTRGGLTPLGTLQAGFLASAFGAPIAVLVMGGMLAGITFVSSFVLPRVRHIEYSDDMSDRY